MDPLVDRIDALQRRWRVTAFLWAVQKKYSDDRGGYLAALVTYYGFLSIFPLILAAFTIVAYVLSGDRSAVASLERHIAGYPIVGPAARALENKRMHGQPFALVIGVAGLVWGAQGLAQAAQFTMGQAWNIKDKNRFGFLPRTLRSFAWYATFGLGVVVSTTVSSAGELLHWTGGDVLSTVASFVVDIAMFAASFRILTPSGVRMRQMLPGAVAAGVAWAVLTGIGVALVPLLNHSNPLYGSFTSVLALLGYIYLCARATILSVEASVVKARSLWPRSLTSRNLTPADLRQLESIAGREERVKGEQVGVEIRS
ncbi:MAG TPA: YihY/virulence factor BrkB family protein [Acidimicrobiales bacterium]|nr:YihY/virulence factor BrkB family protein [Acidimicrobiales bacterium]